MKPPYHLDNNIIAKILGVNAITLYPFVLYSKAMTKKVYTHEMVHVEQIKRDGFFYFYINYLYQYLKNRYNNMDHATAYLSIPYEKEAFERESK